MTGNDAAETWLWDRLGCDARAFARLSQFVDALVVENGRQNLVSAASLAEVWWRHIVDSAQLLLVPRGTTSVAGPWLDLGSGAGFPGLVVAMIRTDVPVLLVEERSRRSDWLTRIAGELSLSNVQVVATTVAKLEHVSAKTISARAFAPLPRLLELAWRFSTPETTWLLPKGERAQQEVDGLPEQLRAMFHVEPSLTNPKAGIIVGQGQIRAI